jgi:hypothetical protein
MLSAPGKCGICNTDFPNLASAMAHFQQTYMPSGMDWMDFERVWQPSTGVVNLPPDTSRLSKHGIDFSSANQRAASSLPTGKYISEDDAIIFIRQTLGENSARLVDVGEFLVQYLVWVCTHASTDKTADTGRFIIIYQQSKDAGRMTWEAFFTALADWGVSNDYGTLTPRSFQIATDKLLQETYATSAEKVQILRSEGTRRSAHYLSATGKRAAVWMTVPDLFISRRDEVPEDMTNIMNSYVHLDQVGGHAFSTVLDQDAAGAKRVAFARLLQDSPAASTHPAA